MKKVSVIVPVYNVSEYLERCLESLLTQAERDIEIICVDDGSTDESPAILSRYASRDSRFRTVSLKNGGAGAARNAGMDLACGDYLFFCDSDDWCDPDMLRDMSCLADRTAADVVVAEFCIDSGRLGDATSERILFPSRTAMLPETFSRKDDSDSLFGDFHPMVWNKLFRRSFIQSTGLRYQEIPRVNDMYFAFSALALAERISCLPNAYYHYRRGVQGSLQSTLQKSPRDFIAALTAVRDELVRRNLYVVLRKAFVNAAFGVCWENLYRMSDLKLAEELFYHLRTSVLASLDLDALDEGAFNDRWLYERYREFVGAADFSDYTWRMTLACRSGQMGALRDCPYGILVGEVDAFANKIIARINRSVISCAEQLGRDVTCARDKMSLVRENESLRSELAGQRAELQSIKEELARCNGMRDSANRYLNDILWELRENARYRDRGWVRNLILGIPLMGRIVWKGYKGVRKVRREGVLSLLPYFRKMPCINEVIPCNIRVADIISQEMELRFYAGVYIIPTIPWDVPIYQRPQQMASAFARKGFLVVYLEDPTIAKPRGTIAHPIPGVVVVTLNAEEFMASLDGVKGAIVSIYSTTFMHCHPDSRLFSREFVKSNKVVYEYIDHFDEKISGPGVLSLRKFLDDLIAKKMPVIYLASARRLQKELEDRIGHKVLYVANGVDDRHFSEENAREIGRRVNLPRCLTLSRPKIGYFGALAPWLDYELIGAVVEAHPEWDFIFIGPDYNGGSSRLPSRALNCHWIGPVPYADLPAYAIRFDVAILPFQSGDLAKSTSPLKLFEYFALGKPVVVTPDMAECTEYPEVMSGTGVEGFALAIDKALKISTDAKAVEAIKRLGQANTWDERASALIRGSRYKTRGK